MWNKKIERVLAVPYNSYPDSYLLCMDLPPLNTGEM